MKVVIIGAGNVATVLGKKIIGAGHSVEQVISRTKSHAAELAALLNAASSDNFREINNESDLYIIAVADDLIQEVASQLVLKKKLIVHTAGSVSKSVLKVTGGDYGVLYPIQSLRKELSYIPEIPIAVDGNSVDTINTLETFALGWTSKVSIADDVARLKLHVAAVISSNFINHIFALTEIYCKKEKLDFKVLLPLIEETTNRLKNYSASDVQTGPAIREDINTIDKHLKLLEDHPSLKLLYGQFTESIVNHNQQGSL